MDKSVLEILRLYLSGDIDFDSLEDQVVLLAFKADDQDGQLVYEVLAEIAYVKDEVSDETTFKTRSAVSTNSVMIRYGRKAEVQ